MAAPLPPDPLGACRQAHVRIAAADDEDLARELGDVTVLLVLAGHRGPAGRIWRAAVERDVEIGAVLGHAGEAVADAWSGEPFMADAAELDEINSLVRDEYSLPRPTGLPDASAGEHLELQRWRWAQRLAGSVHVPPGEPDWSYQGYEPRDERAAAAVLHDLLADLDFAQPPDWATDALVLAAFLAARAGRPETACSHLRSWVLVSRATGGEPRPARVLTLAPLRALVLEGALEDAIGIRDREAGEIADQVLAALGVRMESGAPAPPTIPDLDVFLDDWFERLRTRGVVPTDAVRPAGATDAGIAAAEVRLGVRLPPDYADFLRAANGWPSSDEETPGLRSVERIDWFRVGNQAWIDVYTEPDGAADEWERELSGALQVSDEGDGVVFLLNRHVNDPEGNWEPWVFGDWIPGANRFRSFAELLSYMRDDEDDEG